MRDTLTLRFLYRTVPGRALLKILVQPKVSGAAGCILSTGISKRLVPYYIRKHKIDMNGIDIPAGGFSSFNDFFTRKRIMESFDLTPGHLISPCDGFLTPVEIGREAVFSIKNTCYSLGELLKDDHLAKRFEGGLALIFRLTPANYHRYCYAAEGYVIRSRKIPGKLHCVRPVALGAVPVFVQNSREYQAVVTDRFRTMVQMEIGALLVGRIRNHRLSADAQYVQAGAEKGYFEFGGSTIVLLLQKDTVFLREALYQRMDENGEMPVRMGECVAQAKDQ
jgi:phosphatidylserine decarboxylase